MSRRALVVIALVVASSSLTACADSLTAPRQPTAPASAPRANASGSSTCPGGFILSEGRCG